MRRITCCFWLLLCMYLIGFSASEVLAQNDGFITKLSANGNRFVFSTLLGGSGGEFWLMPTLDNAGNIVIVGQTDSQSGNVV